MKAALSSLFLFLALFLSDSSVLLASNKVVGGAAESAAGAEDSVTSTFLSPSIGSGDVTKVGGSVPSNSFSDSLTGSVSSLSLMNSSFGSGGFIETGVLGIYTSFSDLPIGSGDVASASRIASLRILVD